MADDVISLSYRPTPELVLSARRARPLPGQKGGAPWGLRLLGWLFVGLAIGLALALIGAFDRLPDGATIGALFGYALAMAVRFAATHRRTEELRDRLADLIARQGDTRALFDAEGACFATALGESRQDWAAFDGVSSLNGATILHSGGTLVPIPDAALPPGLDGAAFRDRLSGWIGGAR